MSQRDYSKFLTADGRLDVKLLPRRAYTELVTRHRQRDEVIEEVFGDFYFLWDLNDLVARKMADGIEISRSDAAQQVLDGMEDEDWWRVMRAFEECLIRDFEHVAAAHVDILDPIYDEQEQQGWVQLQP